MVILGFS